MTKIYRFVFNQDDADESDRQTQGLAGIAVSLLVIVVCLVLVKQLHRISHVEDCMMQGRTNCDQMLLGRAR
jgi:hypothetical protein